MTTYQVITETLVNVFISSNCNSFTSEKKFAKDLTIADLKGKLELITGASSLSMVISAFDKNDKPVCELSDDAALLGSYPLDSGMRIHVLDTTKNKDEFENLANVEKFELSKEDYSKRDDTVQSFLKRNKMGKYNEEELRKMEEEKAKVDEEENALMKAMHIGDRCEVKAPGAMTRRGEVKYLGQVDFKTGNWVGVKYDEPLGKNDGCVDGKRYFSCPDKYGGFVKLAHVTVGDFPEESLDLSDDEM
eukprot:maker-scaffold106_size358372-snap-gene-0.14 protein:Tk03532 transcript:maker-scaffold106_size358372-snap-gene-0.14-mRNA-1 annotation:"tubulin folding cofactor b"